MRYALSLLSPRVVRAVVLFLCAMPPLACGREAVTRTQEKRVQQGGSMTLFAAAEQGDLSGVQKLLRLGVDVNQRDADGYIALHYAGRCGDLRVVRSLLAAGADVNARSKDGVTPLMASIDMAFGKPDITLALLEAGSDVNAVDSQGHTALWIATTESSVDVMRELLRRGANPNVRLVAGGNTPLHMAAMNGLAERVELLLRFGANATARNDRGQTPLDLASGRSAETRRLLERAAGKTP